MVRSRNAPTPPPSGATPTCRSCFPWNITTPTRAARPKPPFFANAPSNPAGRRPEVSTPQDALLVTLGERGRVDLGLLSHLLHRKPSEFLPDLKGAIFLNPQTDLWETEDEYLSGNVRAKLAVAEAAALADKQFRPNVEALRQVQPADLPATEIDARLGSAWIPAEDISRFAEELLGEQGISVSHAPQLGLWTVQGGYGVRFSVANTTEWGTDRRSALELLEDALNLRTPTVYDHDPDTDRDVINAPATEAARDKQEKIKERFKQWVWQDDERRERLARKYNDEFNNVRLRSFNGDHLRLPGASSAITLHPHQRAAVWRILQTPNCLLAHVVGAGKTYTMVAAAMELKRLGLARKPLFAVPNHMLGQFSSELLTLYPGANILVATKDDFEKDKRKTLTSRIATGNWDAVIMTHSGFEKIPDLARRAGGVHQGRNAGTVPCHRATAPGAQLPHRQDAGTGQETPGRQTQGTRRRRAQGRRTHFRGTGRGPVVCGRGPLLQEPVLRLQDDAHRRSCRRPLRSGRSTCSSRCSMSSA